MKEILRFPNKNTALLIELAQMDARLDMLILAE